jgi:hypothetical protein
VGGGSKVVNTRNIIHNPFLVFLGGEEEMLKKNAQDINDTPNSWIPQNSHQKKSTSRNAQNWFLIKSANAYLVGSFLLLPAG